MNVPSILEERALHQLRGAVDVRVRERDNASRLAKSSVYDSGLLVVVGAAHGVVALQIILIPAVALPLAEHHRRPPG